MTELSRTHLDQLENQSIFIFREAYHAFKNIAMPWSMGKDSNVLIWLARKSFFGKVPFPVLHIDTTYEFPEMLEFRAWATKHYNLNLIVKINTEARERGVGYEKHDPVTVTHELKTVALQQALAQYKWDALITGIRRDEDPTRAKERYFSPRNAQFEWDYKDQPLDVAPDIDFGPIKQRLHTDVLAFGRVGYELSPEFRRFSFVIPFKFGVARRKISLLGASWIFVAPDASDERVPFVFGQHLLERDRFQFVRHRDRVMRLVTDATLARFGVDLHD